MKLLSPTNYRSMPWKNGAGTTVEIAVYPDHAGLDNFVWRVSRAQVVANGSFSNFAGIDRSLALLQGVGMKLWIDGQTLSVDQRDNIACFPGDANIHAELIDGPISDFNLMSRRSAALHELTHWVGEASRRIPANAVLVYCATGSGRLISDLGSLALSPDHCAQFESADQNHSWHLQTDANSRFYCIQISKP